MGRGSGRGPPARRTKQSLKCLVSDNWRPRSAARVGPCWTGQKRSDKQSNNRTRWWIPCGTAMRAKRCNRTVQVTLLYVHGFGTTRCGLRLRRGSTSLTGDWLLQWYGLHPSGMQKSRNTSTVSRLRLRVAHLRTRKFGVLQIDDSPNAPPLCKKVSPQKSSNSVLQTSRHPSTPSWHPLHSSGAEWQQLDVA